jgi:hypothetical protein
MIKKFDEFKINELNWSGLVTFIETSASLKDLSASNFFFDAGLL